MKRLSRFSDAHPILSIIAGYLLIVAIALVLLPAETPGADVVAQRSAT